MKYNFNIASNAASRHLVCRHFNIDIRKKIETSEFVTRVSLMPHSRKPNKSSRKCSETLQSRLDFNRRFKRMPNGRLSLLDAWTYFIFARNNLINESGRNYCYVLP